MKINKSLTITDLPGGMTLERMTQGILVTLPEGGEGRTFSPAELTEIRDALNVILDGNLLSSSPRLDRRFLITIWRMLWMS